MGLDEVLKSNLYALNHLRGRDLQLCADEEWTHVAISCSMFVHADAVRFCCGLKLHEPLPVWRWILWPEDRESPFELISGLDGLSSVDGLQMVWYSAAGNSIVEDD